MIHDPVLERARQGDSRAIEILLNTALESHQVIARTRAKNDTLLVVLEAALDPDRTRCIDLLRQSFQDINTTAFHSAEIFARRLGDAFPAWTTVLPLRASAAQEVNQFQEYEFSAQQNQFLSDFARKSRLVGYFMVGIGGLLLTPAFLFLLSGAMAAVKGGFMALLPGLLQAILPGIILIIKGFSSYNLAKQIDLIVKTEGQDIDHLMQGFAMVCKVNDLLIWLFSIGLVAGLIMVGLFIPVVLSF